MSAKQDEGPAQTQAAVTPDKDAARGNGQDTNGARKADCCGKDCRTSDIGTTGSSAEVTFKFRVSVSREEHLDNLHSMAMREDDIIIAANYKAGTHWLWEVVHMLTSGRAEYAPRTKEHYMLEFNDVERFDPMPSPRIINTHLYLRYLSPEIEAKRVRVLHVMRNPKDVAVSLYFHRRQRQGYEDKGVAQAIRDFLSSEQGQSGNLADYAAYLREMERWEKQHPQVPMMHLYFEDMKQNPLETVKKLGKFLGVEASESLCADIAEACSFNQLKKASETKEILQHQTENVRGAKMDFYRRGEVGDWKNYFTVAMNEEWDALIAEHLKDCSLATKLKYSL